MSKRAIERARALLHLFCSLIFLVCVFFSLQFFFYFLAILLWIRYIPIRQITLLLFAAHTSSATNFSHDKRHHKVNRIDCAVLKAILCFSTVVCVRCFSWLKWSRHHDRDAPNTSHKIYYQYITPNRLNMSVAAVIHARPRPFQMDDSSGGVFSSLSKILKYWTFEVWKTMQRHCEHLTNEKH